MPSPMEKAFLLQFVVCAETLVEEVPEMLLCFQVQGVSCIVFQRLTALKLRVQGIVHTTW